VEHIATCFCWFLLGLHFNPKYGGNILLPVPAGFLPGLLYNLNMVAIYSSETVGFLQTIWYYNPEERIPYHHHDNCKFNTLT
jgi:hypothetical protein